MKHGIGKFLKGMGLGLMVGCMAGAAANQCMQTGRRGMKKSISRAMKNMSRLAEEVGDMF